MTGRGRSGWKDPEGRSCRPGTSARWIAALASALACASTGELRPFTSDGCSRFFDGTPFQRELWKYCCYEHDKRYWRGGTREERRATDRELRSCVDEVQDPVLAFLMYEGVRVGGSPYWPSSYRWGYGWPYGRGYRALGDGEQALADRLLEERELRQPAPLKPATPQGTPP